MASRECAVDGKSVDVDTGFKTDPQDEEFVEVKRKGGQRIKSSNGRAVTWSLIRPLPDPPLPSGRYYVRCNRGETCLRGPRCTFAHSQEEMVSWNNQLSEQMRHQPAPATERSSQRQQLQQSIIADRSSAPAPRPVSSMIKIY